jgi:hypothetical protein
MAGDAITGDELRAAIDRLGWYMQRGPDGEPATHPADRIIRDVERHRESGYEPGEAYRDADGAAWVYSPRRDATAPWLKPGCEGSWSTPTPKRPLTRLVPEGSSLAGSERDLIRADLGRLLEVLGLGDFARPQSSHEVFGMCIAEVVKLKEASRG